MQKKLLYIIFFSFLPLLSYSQTVKDSLINILRNTKPTDTTYLLTLAELSNEYRYDNPDTSLILAQKAAELSKNIKYGKGLGRAFRVIGIYYRTKGKLKEAIEYMELSVVALKKVKDAEGLAFAYNSLAAIYKNQANTILAIDYCLKALNEFEKMNNQKGIVYVLNNLVNIYLEQGNYDKALEYAQKCQVISEVLQDKKMLFYSYFNLGEIYQYQKQYEKALSYQLKNIKIAEEDKDKANLAYACNNIGFLYIALKKNSDALPYLQKGITLAKEIKSEERLATLFTTLAIYYNAINQPQIAFGYANDALKMAKKLKNTTLIANAAYENSIAAAKIGKYQEAYESYTLHKQTTDSLQNEKKYKQSMQKDFAYQQEKQNLEQQKKQIEYEAELEQQKIIRNSFIIGFILMVGLVFGAFWAYRNKQKTNQLLEKQNQQINMQKQATQKALETVKMQQSAIEESNKELNQANEELHQQQEELVMLNEHLETQKHTIEETYSTLKITSEQLNKSIEYASNIQTIILPERQELREFFADIFIIYKPRDVVSGDFYWFSKINEAQAVFVLADCTGHGVPGAFMSMLGSTLLHEIINIKQNYNNPALILQDLDINLRYVLKQEKGLNSDGMDISVCFFDKNIATKTTILTFAGAKSFMYYIENNEIVQISGDKIYLGGRSRVKQAAFVNKIFTLTENTPFYLLTDGIIDQNDEYRHKLGANSLKEVVLQHCQKTMEIQQEHILKLLATHQKNSEQRDDISMVGLRMF